MIKWENIENAPKDGTILLVYGYYIPYNMEKKYIISMASYEQNFWTKKYNWRIYYENSEDIDEIIPSHWMPLPELPKKDGKNGLD